MNVATFMLRRHSAGRCDDSIMMPVPGSAIMTQKVRLMDNLPIPILHLKQQENYSKVQYFLQISALCHYLLRSSCEREALSKTRWKLRLERKAYVLPLM